MYRIYKKSIKIRERFGSVKYLLIFSCAQGISRSASVIIAYVMVEMKMGYEKAFNFVKSKREIICPNNSFRQQLMNFENKNKNCTIF
jgi:protein-tyrosine phosphatase